MISVNSKGNGMNEISHCESLTGYSHLHALTGFVTNSGSETGFVSYFGSEICKLQTLGPPINVASRQVHEAYFRITRYNSRDGEALSLQVLATQNGMQTNKDDQRYVIKSRR